MKRPPFALRSQLRLFLFVTLLASILANADEEIGFAERFALAEDRAEAIRELVPGTEEFYFYSSLLAQQQGRLDAVEGLLEPWVKRHGETPKVIEIRNRQALLKYSDEPGESLEYLRKQLGLRFDHQQEKLDAKPDFPTRLDPALVTFEAFLKRSAKPNSIGGISDGGLDELIRSEVVLNEGQRKELLSRLQYPDYERLVGMIAADLRTKSSRGFGEYEIHRRLTLEQLDELLGLHPDLIRNASFVDAKLFRLRPNGDVSLDRDSAARKVYLDRLWSFVRDLDPAFHSLKASVLFQKLEWERRQGNYPLNLFLDYLRLPRATSYVEPRFLNGEAFRAGRADLNADFRKTTGFAPIQNDEALVREYLAHFFLEDDTVNRFSTFVREGYLKKLLATTKLMHGIGDAQQWFSMLSPGEVQELKERVEISFAPTNQENFSAADEVALALDLKNVNELIVKVYQINTLNYYLDQKREINTDLNLDGLVANEEKTYQYEQSPVRRHRESFVFDSMKGKRGVWVVEFIGNGISSRALIRKGKLQFLSRTTPGGELVRVFTEANTPVDNAAIRMGGTRYEANEDGAVLLPFSTAGEVPVVLEDGSFSSLARITLPPENYDLGLGAILERETLLPGRESRIILRPQVSLQGEPVSTGLLEKVTLQVKTVDLDGVESISEKKDFELFDEQESVYQFRVPSRLRTVTATLSAEMEKVTDSANPQKLSRSVSFDVNGSSMHATVGDVYLSRFEEDYVVEVLGKSGEALQDHLVDVTVVHPDFTRPFQGKLKTDAKGRIAMGSLNGISQLGVAINGVPARTWPLDRDSFSYPASLHAAVGEDIAIPFPKVGDAPDRRDFAVWEVRNGVFVRDVFAKANSDSGAIVLSGLEAGDYRVLLRGAGNLSMDVFVTDQEGSEFGYTLSANRHLQETNTEPMRIASLDSGEEALTVSLAHANEQTRVHLIATRFLPEVSSFLQSVKPYPLYRIGRGTNESLFLSGRDIGEEYRYILERRASKQFPGNMLPRPGLILNPWELNKTETATDEAEEGEDYKKSKDMKRATRGSVPPAQPAEAPGSRVSVFSSSFDFLSEQAVVLANLEVGEDGTLSIPFKNLRDRQNVLVVAVDGENVATRMLALGDRETKFRDLRLQQTLDLEKTFTQRRHVTLLEKDDALTIEDLRAAELETYGTIGEVFSALAAIQPDPNFQKFGFIQNWPELDEAAKRKLYSDFASHELNFFLSRKDPEFFDEVILPYLKHKKDKTFLDHYLLKENLESFLAPWEFGQLNVVERILLGRRLGGEESGNVASHVRSLHELIPPDPNRRAMVYRQALRGLRANAAPAAGSRLELATANGAFGFSGGGAGADAFADIDAVEAAPAAPASDPFAAPADYQTKSRAAGSIAPRMLGRGAAGVLRSQAKGQVLYRKLESTKEWAENNYYQIPIEQQNGELITTNAFWLDFAEWDGNGGFYSREFPEATRNLSEMMLALSVLDLPFAAEEHDVEVEDNTLRFTANSPVVIFHEEIEESERSGEVTPILVSQNFYRVDDRYRFENGMQIDKFVTEEFLTGVVYGSQIVATNPTSAPRMLELLVQIPEGAIPVAGSDYLKSYPLSLQAFSTSQLEVQFYFPSASGEEPFAVYPVQVAMEEKVIASGSTQSFTVVEKPTQFDEASWKYLSQYGSNEEVIRYLATANLHRIDLSEIAWRAREDVDFLRQVTKLVGSRHGFDVTLWSYGIHHNVTSIAREYLKRQPEFLQQSGKWIECELVSLDPVDRHWYQHLEYSPLVNARAHRLGRERKVLNDRFRDQYGQFLDLLSYRPVLNDEEELAVTAYLLLQDRIEEALEWHSRVDPEKVASRLQYDYLTAYASLYREQQDQAQEIAAAYLEHPVERWRERFAKVESQVKEINDGLAGPEEGESREEQLEKLSASDPFFELSAVGREAEISFRNLEEVTVNYYEMDLEFLFSSKPFVSGGSGQFSYIRPNSSEKKKLPEGKGAFRFEVPEKFASSNVLVEVVAAGKTESVAVYSNQLKVALSGRYGRIEVRHEESGKPLPRTYVKVYAKMKGGEVRFFKDGYTDLRGKFDYVSLNTDELDQVEELSLLVMSGENGSLVREVKPPQR
ncbi:MAG: hypothetical protein P1U87_12995 [Verrucomicrobiales bacterium]|nr:hypothetical protein [Verrucomicrobiales bacterium]